MRKKEYEKTRMRSLASEEGQGLQSTLSAFDSDVKSLQSLVKQIDAYLDSSKPQELEQISSKVAMIVDRMEARKGELLQLEPTLDAVKRSVDDQERHKKLLKQNIDILEAGERMKVLETEVEELEDKRAGIEGHSTVSKEYVAAKQLKEELLQKKANYDGRFASYVEQIRALKVSLFVKVGRSLLYVAEH
jgi:predicted  nucleic acid-binding Zn-ribbon protein